MNAVTSALGKTTIVLGFTGPGVTNGLLPDGRYVLTADGSHMTSTSGLAVDAAGSGVRGSVASIAFTRLFGDLDSDGGVSINDFNAFTSAFGKAQDRLGGRL